jgi:thiamine biosynthesis lipoprotein
MRAWFLLSFALACPACEQHPREGDSPAANSHPVPLPPPFAPERIDRVGEAMGTQIRLIAFTREDLAASRVEQAFAAALAEIRRLEALMTTWNDRSELSKVNAQAGQWQRVSPETLEVFQKSRWASELSRGAFDVTFHALSGVWKFGDAAEKAPQLPDAQLIRDRLQHVDYRKVALDSEGKRVKLPEGAAVDFGGIAKGYAVDRAAAVLQAQGLHSFLLQAGGDLYGLGRKPDGKPWTSGVRDPRGGPEDFFALIEIEGHAFSTAGDYARSFIVGGKRYHHILDPKTGYPATASRSVTIWAKDAFTADAIDDAVFILGPEQGMALVESLPDTGAVIVDAHNKVWVSERLQGKIKLLKNPTDAI